MAPERHYPTIAIAWPAPPAREELDRLLAELQDTGPTAVEDRTDGLLVYYTDLAACERGLMVLREVAPELRASLTWISDEAWAERSQADLGPIAVGRLIVAPPWVARAAADANPDAIVITIQPSMGFGTGHHQTTRLCLQLLCRQRLDGASVLDVGTGSGVLAIAASRLGACRVVAIDTDADAVTSARENIELNLPPGAIEVHVADAAADLASLGGPHDLLLANLTGATLERLAPVLLGTLAPDGVLIVSGLLQDERSAVAAAFAAAGARVLEAVAEDDWAALLLGRSGPSPAGP